MTSIRFIAILLILLLPKLISAQEVELGENKSILGIQKAASFYDIAYQDLEKAEKGESSYFVYSIGKTFGPYAFVEVLQTEGGSYFVATAEGKQTLFCCGTAFGPFKNAFVGRISIEHSRILLINETKKGWVTEEFQLSGSNQGAVSVKKSTPHKGVLDQFYVSEKMNTLMVFIDQKQENRKYALYNNQKVENFYEVHFLGWLKNANNSDDPMFYGIYCAHPENEGDPYSMTNNIYIGTRNVVNLIAILYDFTFNSTNTDFIVKGYEFQDSPAKVYTSSQTLGPYESVDNLKYNQNDLIQFNYPSEQGCVEYIGGKLLPSDQLCYYPLISPNFDDTVQVREIGDMNTITYKGKTLFEAPMFSYSLVGWTMKYGPVFMIIDEDSLQLNFGGQYIKNVSRMVDFQLGPNGEMAYLTLESDEFYVYKEEMRYGPYSGLMPLGKDHSTFLQWSDDGKELIYLVIMNNKTHIYNNGKSQSSYLGPIKLMFNKNLNMSIILHTVRQDCFMEYDFIIESLDGWLFQEFNTDESEIEYNSKKEELRIIKNCIQVYIQGKAYDGFANIRNFALSPNGEVVAFDNLETPILIVNGFVFQGKLMEGSYVYYDGKTIREVTI